VPVPNSHAGDVAILMYLSLFREMGWRTLFCPLYSANTSKAAEQLNRHGTVVLDSPKALKAWLRQHGGMLNASWVARPAVGQAVLPDIKRCSTAPVIYFTHDLHYLRLERESHVLGDHDAAFQAVAMKKTEAALFDAVDGILTPSEYEASEIRQYVGSKPVHSIPLHFYNETDIQVRSASHFESRSDILFVGGFPHRPNIDAAEFLARCVMPVIWQRRPDARLVLVGHSPPANVTALANDRIIVTGHVADLTPYYDNARIALLGLRYGAGVKGKALEAFRLGVPVCGTTIAMEGINFVPGRDALVSDTAEGLAAESLKLLNDASLCGSLSAAGGRLVRRYFTRQSAMTAITKMLPRQ